MIGREDFSRDKLGASLAGLLRDGLDRLHRSKRVVAPD